MDIPASPAKPNKPLLSLDLSPPTAVPYALSPTTRNFWPLDISIGPLAQWQSV